MLDRGNMMLICLWGARNVNTKIQAKRRRSREMGIEQRSKQQKRRRARYSMFFVLIQEMFVPYSRSPYFRQKVLYIP